MDDTQNYIKRLHPHRITFFGFYLAGGVFVILGFFLFGFMLVAGFIAIAIGLVVFALAELSRQAETFYILDSGIEHGYKLLASSREFVDYNKIQDLDVSQSFFQRMFGIGNIDFDTAGKENAEMVFYGVSDPYGLEKIIRDQMGRPATTPTTSVP